MHKPPKEQSFNIYVEGWWEFKIKRQNANWRKRQTKNLEGKMQHANFLRFEQCGILKIYK